MTNIGSRSKRLWLADHLLRDGVGHHLGYNLALAEAAADAGWEPHLVTHRKFDRTLANGRKTKRIFRTDWRATPPRWMRGHWRVLKCLESFSVCRFGADLRKLDDEMRPSDIVLAQMLAPRHFLQWLKWVSRLPSPPHLAMHLGYQPHRFDPNAMKRRWARMPSAIRNKIRLITDSQKLVIPFEEALGLRVHYLPHVVSYDFPAPETLPTTRPIVFFAPGNARREKGFADIVRAAALLADERARGLVHFRIQCHQPDDESADILDGKLPDETGIEWISRRLSEAEYVDHIRRADVILLPYHLDCYELRTSGVFCEALTAGKPVIATEGSWLGDRIARDGGGWLTPERDPAALAQRLPKVLDEIEKVSETARILAPAAREEFSHRRFLEGLLRVIAA